MEVFAGEFTAAGGTGTQAITGVGFIPDALIIMICAIGSTDTWKVDCGYSYGFATGLSGSETMCAGGYLRDGRRFGGGHTEKFTDEGGIRILEEGSTVLLDFDIDSWDADGFTIDKATDGALRVQFIAIKCDNAKAISQARPTSTGSHGWTGVGFQPDLWIGVGGTQTTAPANSDQPTNAIGAYDGSIQFAVGHSHRLKESGSGQGAWTSTSFADTDLFRMYLANAVGLLFEGNATAFGSDGITINWTTVSAAADLCFNLALKDSEGFRVRNNWDTSASTGNQSITDLGLTPRGLMFISPNHGTQNAEVRGVEMTIGFCDEAGNESSYTWTDKDEVGVGLCDNYIDTNDAFHGGLIGGSTVRVADHQSMDVGGFTVDWEIVSGSVRSGFIAFGDSATPPPPLEDNAVARGKMVSRASDVPPPVLIW